MDDQRIAQIISLPKLRVYDADLLSYESINPFEPQYKLVDKNTYLGIEVEIENVLRYDHTSPYWSQIEDGSLRNNGSEFVSLPIKAWRVEQALSILFADLNPSIEFTERTSVHIHMNIRTLTLKQLESLIITYIVFEKVLFDFVGENRYNNIFCVPIVETTFGSHLKTLINKKVLSFPWQKYTAMNAVPIWEKGTLEFRHLSGTRNIERIITWINLLLSLKVFALQKSPEYIWDRILSLNTNSEYRIFGEEVFKTHLLTLWNNNFNKNISECISYIKESCLENEFAQELQEQPVRLEDWLQSIDPIPERATWTNNIMQNIEPPSIREIDRVTRQEPTRLNITPRSLFNDLVSTNTVRTL